MKIISLFLLMMMAGCSSVEFFPDNPACLSSRKFKIAHTFDDGAVLYECTFFKGCSSGNQKYFIKNLPNVDFYDAMIIEVPENQCAVQKGTFTYTTKRTWLYTRHRTIPKIIFINK